MFHQWFAILASIPITELCFC